MSLIDLVRDGTDSILPGLSPKDLSNLEQRLGGPLPSGVRELLREIGGYVLEDVAIDFGDLTSCPYAPFAPQVIPVIPNECGGMWFVDVAPNTGTWLRVLSVTHNPPVITFECESFTHLIERHVRGKLFDESLALARSTYDLDLNSGVSADELLESPDRDLRSFANSLDRTFRIVDLRSCPPPAGFIAFRSKRPEAEFRRYASELIFGVQEAPSQIALIEKMKRAFGFGRTR